MVKSACLWLFGLGLWCACGNDKGVSPVRDAQPELPVPPAVTGIRDSLVLFADKQPFVIPHYADSAYTVLFCVRHAEKAKDGTENPPLLPEGVLRATRLADMLSGTRLDRIGCSNLKRNMQTAEAVKARCQVPALDVFASDLVFDWAQDLLISTPGKHVLYVGHSNTIPELLNRLTVDGIYSAIPDSDYSRLYVVVTRGLGESKVWEFRF